MRSERSLFALGPLTNHALNRAALTSILLVLLVVLSPLAAAFGRAPLPVPAYGAALGLILVPLLAMEGAKAFGRIRHQR